MTTRKEPDLKEECENCGCTFGKHGYEHPHRCHAGDCNCEEYKPEFQQRRFDR